MRNPLASAGALHYIGAIWQPGFDHCAQSRELTAYDVENSRAYGDGNITRDAVEHWLALNSGDFRGVDDFRGHVEGVEFDWTDPESELTYCDAMFPAED
jgi:hypothetical protein